MASYGAVSNSNNKSVVSKLVKNYVGIVSKANGAITTIEDLKEAIRLTELMMGIKTDKSQEKRFSEEVLKEHIHEQLKDQCLAKFAQKNGWVSQKEVDATFADIAKRTKYLNRCIFFFLKIRRDAASIISKIDIIKNPPIPEPPV